MAYGVVVRHHFEAAHRVPVIGGKCRSLHGHSWGCEIEVRGPELASGMIVELGAFKAGLRSWIDENLDHATLLSANDPLVPVLAVDETKLYRFGAADPDPVEQLAVGLAWPTVESLAEVLRLVAAEVLNALPHAPAAKVVRVAVSETARNTGYWEDDGHEFAGRRSQD